jgi:hypothetical protein
MHAPASENMPKPPPEGGAGTTPARNYVKRPVRATRTSWLAVRRPTARLMSAFPAARRATSSTRCTSCFRGRLRCSGAFGKRSPGQHPDWLRSGHRTFSWTNFRKRKNSASRHCGGSARPNKLPDQTYGTSATTDFSSLSPGCTFMLAGSLGRAVYERDYDSGREARPGRTGSSPSLSRERTTRRGRLPGTTPDAADIQNPKKALGWTLGACGFPV